MNPIDPLTQISPYTSASNPIFEIKFLNLEYIFYRIYLFFTGGDGAGGVVGADGGEFAIRAPSFWQRLFGGGTAGEVAGADTINTSMILGFVKDLLYLFILFMIVIIIYCTIRMLEIRKKEHEHLHHEIHEFAHKKHQEGEVKAKEKFISRNEAWVKVVKYMEKEDEGSWRMAIIDADKMLDTLTDQLNLVGETLGEKLKSADRDRWQSLDRAWEARNIRNKIAHEGSNYVLTRREAERVIGLYEQVFAEFGYI